MAKLTKAQRETLKEMDRYEHRGWVYWFREASCRALAELGLAEQYLPPSVAQRPRMKARPYRITPAGRAALSQPGDGR